MNYKNHKQTPYKFVYCNVRSVQEARQAKPLVSSSKVNTMSGQQPQRPPKTLRELEQSTNPQTQLQPPPPVRRNHHQTQQRNKQHQQQHQAARSRALASPTSNVVFSSPAPTVREHEVTIIDAQPSPNMHENRSRIGRKHSKGVSSISNTPLLADDGYHQFEIEVQKPLDKWDWYHGSISREEAELVLFNNRSMGDNAFLIRSKLENRRASAKLSRNASGSKGLGAVGTTAYVLSVMDKARPTFHCRHIKIMSIDNGRHFTIENKRFTSLAELVAAYTREGKLALACPSGNHIVTPAASTSNLSIAEGCAITTSVVSGDSDGQAYIYIPHSVGYANLGNLHAGKDDKKAAYTVFKTFTGAKHYHPDPRTQYFDVDTVTGPWAEWRVLTVVFPFFNEEGFELARSLQSMHEQAQKLFKLKVRVHVVCVMDGWHKASSSMKKYIKDMYPANIDEPVAWYDTIEGSNAEVETYTLQRVSRLSSQELESAGGNHMKEKLRAVRLVPIGENMSLKVSMIIKKDNRRKHNSHMWFFNAFCPSYSPEYALATDCGTLFERQCVKSLVHYMDMHPQYAGATGRQRVMTREMQGCEGESMMARWYRAAQKFDYEASISCSQGAFALSGMLPVLPGPCGLYRYADIKGDCLEYYFDTVNHNPDTAGMLKGNLLLAEDRVLSFAASLKTGKFTTWVPHATFYFEAETDTDKFIAQRRRWTNGAFAGYIYLLLQNPSLIWQSPHSVWFKISCTFLNALQLMIYLLVTIAPAVFASGFWFALDTIWPESWSFNLGGEEVPISLFIYMAYGLVYVLYVVTHTQLKFAPLLYWVGFVLNAVGMVMTFTVMIYTLTKNCIDFGAESLIDPHRSLLITLVLATMAVPFILSLLNSITSFLNMCVSFPAYLLFLPTFVGWFGAYAFARTWDLTWGNRPSDSIVHSAVYANVDDAEGEEKTVKKQYDHKTPITKNQMMCRGYTVAMIILLVNLVLGVLAFFYLSGTAVFVVAIYLASFALITMALSFVFYLFYTPNLVSRNTASFFEKYCCCCCFDANATNKKSNPADMV
eukprot:CFRG0329T1